MKIAKKRRLNKNAATGDPSGSPRPSAWGRTRFRAILTRPDPLNLVFGDRGARSSRSGSRSLDLASSTKFGAARPISPIRGSRSKTPLREKRYFSIVQRVRYWCVRRGRLSAVGAGKTIEISIHEGSIPAPLDLRLTTVRFRPP